MGAVWESVVVSGAWLERMGTACAQGAIALIIVGILCQAWPWLPASTRAWFWRLASLKLPLALLGVSLFDLPVLPNLWPEVRAADLKLMETAELSTTPWAGWSLLCSLLFLMWCVGVGVRLRSLVGRARTTRGLLAAASPVTDPVAHALHEELRSRFGMRRCPRLLDSEEVTVPMVTGVRRPVILLPKQRIAGYGRQELKLILAHEMAHCARRDLLFAWIQEAVGILFFFHPLVHWSARETRAAVEEACDELALVVSGSTPGRYAALLLRVATGAGRPATVIGLRASESFALLRRRLVALRARRPGESRHRWPAGTLIGVFAAGLGPWRLVPIPPPAALPAFAALPRRPAMEAAPTRVPRPPAGPVKPPAAVPKSGGPTVPPPDKVGPTPDAGSRRLPPRRRRPRRYPVALLQRSAPPTNGPVVALDAVHRPRSDRQLSTGESREPFFQSGWSLQSDVQLPDDLLLTPTTENALLLSDRGNEVEMSDDAPSSMTRDEVDKEQISVDPLLPALDDTPTGVSAKEDPTAANEAVSPALPGASLLIVIVTTPSRKTVSHPLPLADKDPATVRWSGQPGSSSVMTLGWPSSSSPGVAYAQVRSARTRPVQNGQSLVQ